MIFIVALLMIPFSAILNGWALSKLWAWFFMPTLGLPALSIPQAIGVACVVTYLTYQHPNATSAEKPFQKVLLGAILISVFRPAFAVAFGWVVQMFL